jgi:hypothetical protein
MITNEFSNLSENYKPYKEYKQAQSVVNLLNRGIIEIKEAQKRALKLNFII